jgi:hypothetical protein
MMRKLIGKYLELVKDEYTSEDDLTEIENKIDEQDWKNLPTCLFKNMVLNKFYSILENYCDEDWYVEFEDDALDNIDRKLSSEINIFTNSKKEMNNEIEVYLKKNINNWLNSYLGEDNDYKI